MAATPPSHVFLGVIVSNPSLILCVDEESTSLTARRLILSIAGYDVMTAASGEAALKIFRRYPVVLVITDQYLPQRTGAELAGEMKLLKPDVPVVLLAASPEDPAVAQHADLVLTKGMNPADFLAAIAKLVGRQPATEDGNQG